MAAPAGAIGQWQSLPFPVRLAGIFLAGMAMIWLTRWLGGISVLSDLQGTLSRLFPASVRIFAALLVSPQLALAQFHPAGDCSPKAAS
jgi:hypothetical protein